MDAAGRITLGTPACPADAFASWLITGKQTWIRMPPRRAIRQHRPALLVHQRVHDRQSQARTAMHGAGLVRKTFGRSRMDAGSPGPRRSPPARPVRRVCAPTPIQRPLAVAQGVFHEVGENLAQPVRVGHDQLALRGGGRCVSTSSPSRPAWPRSWSARRRPAPPDHGPGLQRQPADRSQRQRVQVRDQAAQVQGLVQQAAHFLVADRDDAVADRVQAGAEHRDGRAARARWRPASRCSRSSVSSRSIM